MDLSFPRFEHVSGITELPTGVTVPMLGVSTRQAASPTAILHAHLTPIVKLSSLLAPADGAFNVTVAALFTAWKAK